MRSIYRKLKSAFSSRLWALPLASAVLAAMLAFLLAEIRLPSTGLASYLLWPGDTKAASDLLSFIASTTLTVLTTTISMTLIVLQSASGNFSHQLLRDYIQSSAVRSIVAVYVGVFTYSVLVLRSLDSREQNPPQLAVSVAIGFTLFAVATFIWYVSEVVNMVRVDSIINVTVQKTLKLTKEATDRNDDTNPVPPRPMVPGNARTLRAKQFGFVNGIDRETLADWARDNAATVVVDVRPGDRVFVGQPVAHYWFRDEVAEDSLEIPRSVVRSGEGQWTGEPYPPTCIYIESERYSGEDFSLGLRQLVDIGIRALSSGVNDPTTARHAIGQSATALRQIVLDSPRAWVEYDGDSQGRMVVWSATRSAAELLQEFVSEFRRSGSTEPGVLVDLLMVMEMLEDCSQDQELLRTIAVQRRSIVEAAKRDIPDEVDLQQVLDAASQRDSYKDPPPDKGM